MVLATRVDKTPVASEKREQLKAIWMNNMTMVITFVVNASANQIIY